MMQYAHGTSVCVMNSAKSFSVMLCAFVGMCPWIAGHGTPHECAGNVASQMFSFAADTKLVSHMAELVHIPIAV